MEVAPTTAMAPKNLVVYGSRWAIVVPARAISSRSDRCRSLIAWRRSGLSDLVASC